MSTFTYSLDDDVGKVRLGIGDRVEGDGPRPDGANFTDEELQFLVTQEGTWQRAVAAATEILAREWANISDLTVGDRKEAFSKVSMQYQKVAENLRKSYGGTAYSTAFSVGLKRADGFAEAASSVGSSYG